MREWNTSFPALKNHSHFQFIFLFFYVIDFFSLFSHIFFGGETEKWGRKCPTFKINSPRHLQIWSMVGPPWIGLVSALHLIHIAHINIQTEHNSVVKCTFNCPTQTVLMSCCSFLSVSSDLHLSCHFPLFRNLIIISPASNIFPAFSHFFPQISSSAPLSSHSSSSYYSC